MKSQPPSRPVVCDREKPCWENSRSPADLCDLHLRQYRDWQEAKEARRLVRVEPAPSAQEGSDA